MWIICIVKNYFSDFLKYTYCKQFALLYSLLENNYLLHLTVLLEKTVCLESTVGFQNSLLDKINSLLQETVSFIKQLLGLKVCFKKQFVSLNSLLA